MSFTRRYGIGAQRSASVVSKGVRTPVLLLLLGAAACSADTGGLDGSAPDAAVRDTGVAIFDAGLVPDSGPEADAGPRDTGVNDAGQPVCAEADYFDVTAEGDAYTGSAVVRALDPLTLEVENQRQLVLRFSGLAPILDLTVGEALHVEVELRTPFWQETRIALFELTPQGPGSVFLAAWTGSQFSGGTFDEVRYSYQAEDCVVDDSCGMIEARALRVEFGSQVLPVVVRGEHLVADTFEVYNGPSGRYVDGPLCPDTPAEWYASWIARGRSARPCASLQRDACIASSACVLWGSENSDPSYVCRDAISDCEARPTSDACGGGNNCAWDSGGCYCPENETCACAGGPAPKCRDVCGGFVGLTCPAVRGEPRFCDVPPEAGQPICQIAGDASGICERVPTDCTGTFNGPVCACELGTTPTNFVNDCLRRQASAEGARSGMCP